MQIVYLLPFVLLSLTLGAVCLAVPRWRGYVAGAVIGPVAFAGCAIVSMAAMILSAEALGFDQALGLDEPSDPVSLRGVLVLAITFVLPGAIGARIAALIANRIQGWAMHRLGF